MKFKDQILLEQAYQQVYDKTRYVDNVYFNSELKNIFSEQLWHRNSLDVKLMFVESINIGQHYKLLEEGILSNIGKTLLTPIQVAGKIYTSISKPIGTFIEKYGYENTGLKGIDEKTYNAVVTKFNQYLQKLNPKAAEFIKKSLNEAQSFVKGNPIKMSLLSVALTTSMSFAGAPLLAIFATACLVRGTIGLLKGEKPIQAFGKSILVGVIGKVLGLAGKEVLQYFGGGEAPQVSGGGGSSDIGEVIQNLKQNNPTETLSKFSNLESEGVESNVNNDPLAKYLSQQMGEKQAKLELNQKYLNKLLKYQEQPVSLKELLSDAWKDLGMSEEQIEKFLKNSFQNKNLVNVDLDHKSRFVFVQDLVEGLDKEDLKSWATIMKDFSTINKSYIENTNDIAKILKIPELTQDSTLEEWIKTLDSIKNNEQTKIFFEALKPQLSGALISKIKGAYGFANPGSDVYYLNKSNDVDMQFLFRQIATHEALHTGQSEIPQELVQNIEAAKEAAKNKLLDIEKSKMNQTIQKYPGKFSEEKIKQILANAESKIQKEIDYYSDPKEIQAWLGMAKKTYFKDTGILISNESNDSDINKFLEWLGANKNNDPQMEKVNFLKRILDTTEKSKQIFVDQLKDVAVNEPAKNVSNIA